MVIAYEPWEEEWLAEAKAEYLTDDRVANNITYRYFVSKSKGRRNGKKRIRRIWKEVHLVKYIGGFYQWHRFPFDIYATEIIGQHAVGEVLKERIIDLWGY